MVTVLLNLNCTTQTYSTVRDINALFHDLGHREIGRPFVIEKTVRKTRSEKKRSQNKVQTMNIVICITLDTTGYKMVVAE